MGETTRRDPILQAALDELGGETGEIRYGALYVDVTRNKADEDSAPLYRFIATTAVRDRAGDEIPLSGWDFGPYKKNPVVLWMHGYDLFHQLPVGNTRTIERAEVGGKDAWLMDVEFMPAEIDEFAEKIRRAVDGRWLRACSVGFLPKKSRWIEETDEEREQRVRDDDRAPGRRFLKKELMELSICNVPCNQEALLQARKAFGTGMPRAMERGARRAALLVTDQERRAALERTREIKAELNARTGIVTIVSPLWVSETLETPVRVAPEALTIEATDIDRSADEGVETRIRWNDDPGEPEVQCHVKALALFRADTLRRKTLKASKPRVIGVIGLLKAKDEYRLQALRFPRDDGWDLVKAKAWLKDHPDVVKELEEAAECLDVWDLTDDTMEELFTSILDTQGSEGGPPEGLSAPEATVVAETAPAVADDASPAAAGSEAAAAAAQPPEPEAETRVPIGDMTIRILAPEADEIPSEEAPTVVLVSGGVSETGET